MFKLFDKSMIDLLILGRYTNETRIQIMYNHLLLAGIDRYKIEVERRLIWFGSAKSKNTLSIFSIEFSYQKSYIISGRKGNFKW